MLEGSRQALEVTFPFLADVVVHRIMNQGNVTRQHPRQVLGRVREGVWVVERAVQRDPLPVSTGANLLGPRILQQTVQVVVAPKGRSLGPDHLQARGDSVRSGASSGSVGPTELLVFYGRPLWRGSNARVAGAVSFT